jgi:transposase-like protein
MNLEKEKVVERIKESKEYGLNYSKLAREINVQPVTLYMFINGTYNLSKPKQLQALCIIEKYIEQVKEQLRTIEHKGFL